MIHIHLNIYFSKATPHCVRAAFGPEARGVSRETLAVFMEPMWMEKMNVPPQTDRDNVVRGSGAKNLPPGVPPLDSRWIGDEQDFGSFTEKTLASYY